MAKQIKFYSVSALPSTASTTGADGIYFVDNGELYKGSQRFGLGRVTIASSTTGVTGMKRGDIVVTGSGAGWVFDGNNWQSIGGDISSLTTSWRADISDWISGLAYTSGGTAKDTFILGITKDANGKLTAQTADLAKASVGDSTTTAQHGISAKVTLNRTAKPNLEMTVNAVTTAPGITSAADYFTTGSAIYNYANGLVSGSSTTSYIAAVTRDATTGKLTAHAKAFPEIPTVAGGSSKSEAWTTGPYVSVSIATKTANPSVEIGGFGSAAALGVIKGADVIGTSSLIEDDLVPTAAAVAAAVDAEIATLSTALNSAKANAGVIMITANTTTNHGVAAKLSLKSDAAPTGTITTTPATVDGNFSTSEYLTTGKVVYAHTSRLAAGDNTKYINKIAYANGKLTATASATAHDAASITNAASTSYTLTDVYAVQKYVDGRISNLGTVMHFKGAGTTLPASPSVGDVYVFTANSGNYKKGQEVVYTASGWEVLGDQNQWVDKVTGGSKTVTVVSSTTNSPAITLTAGTEAVTASVTTLGITGLGTAATKDFTTEIAGGGYGASGVASDDKLPTEAAVVTYVGAVVNGNIPENGSSTSTSYGVTISASTIAGVQKSANITVSPVTTSSGITDQATTSLATAAAIAEYVTAKIDDSVPGTAEASDYDKGVLVDVNTDGGSVTQVVVDVTPAALAPNFSTSTYLTTGSTVYAHTSGLSAGGDASYIQKIAYDKSTGKLTATAVAFPSYDYNPTASTSTSTSNGTTVSVTTQNGKVTKVEVAASNWTPETSTKSGTSNNIKVDVTTTSGVVTAVAVSSPFIATEVTKSGTSNGHTVSVTTKNGQVTAVAVAAPAVATATTKTSASKGVQVSVTGHITAVSVVTTLSTTLGADAEHAPTTKAVYEAMCWYSSDGSLIP